MFPERSVTSECLHSPYCERDGRDEIWQNYCGFAKPTESRWKNSTMEDQLWLKKNFENYKALQRSSFGLDSDEKKTFPTYMAKRYAPNVPPSSLICDGLGMCRAPSCKDIGEKHSPEIKERAMLFIEFLSGLNHAYHVIGEATQDHFRHIHEDIRQMTRDFTYADEQQDEAVKKE